MPKLEVLSGKDLVSIFAGFGFGVAGQRGSHVKLRRTCGESVQTLTIHNHRTLDRGTLLAIYRQASRFANREELKPHFYAE
jgi:predicted RNA binding protein YcfA (HicA-like mRNA interferase family)